MPARASLVQSRLRRRALLGQAERQPGREQRGHRAVAREVVLAHEGAERRHGRDGKTAIEQGAEAGARQDRVRGEREARDRDRRDRTPGVAVVREGRHRDEREQCEAGRECHGRERRLRIHGERTRPVAEQARELGVRGMPDGVRAGREHPVQRLRQRHELCEREREQAGERPQRHGRQRRAASERAQHERGRHGGERRERDREASARKHAPDGPRREHRERHQASEREGRAGRGLGRWAHRARLYAAAAASSRRRRAWGRRAAGTLRPDGRAGSPGRTRSRARAASAARRRARCPRR